MAIHAAIEVQGSSIIVKELTLMEVRDWVASIEMGTRPLDPAGDALFEDIGAADIMLMSDATDAQISAATPSELQDLANACKRINPHFFRLRAVMQAAQVAQIRAMLFGHAESRSSEMPA